MVILLFFFAFYIDLLFLFKNIFFAGSSKKAKLIMKGGAVVDPESGNRFYSAVMATQSYFMSNEILLVKLGFKLYQCTLKYELFFFLF